MDMIIMMKKQCRNNYGEIIPLANGALRAEVRSIISGFIIVSLYK